MNKAELNFLVKTAAYNVHRRNQLKRQTNAGVLSPNVPAGGWNNAALGAVTGGLVGAGIEALRSEKKRKNYLRSVIIGTLLGSSQGMVASYLGAPDLTKKIVPGLTTAGSKIKGGATGVINGFKKASAAGDELERDPRFKALAFLHPGLNGHDVYETKGPLGVKALKLKAGDDEDKFIRRRAKLKLLIMSLAGAAVGGGANAIRQDRKPKLSDMLIGAGIGGAAGLGVGHLSNRMNEWAGLDPLVSTVATAKK